MESKKSKGEEKDSSSKKSSLLGSRKGEEPVKKTKKEKEGKTKGEKKEKKDKKEKKEKKETKEEKKVKIEREKEDRDKNEREKTEEDLREDRKNRRKTTTIKTETEFDDDSDVSFSDDEDDVEQRLRKKSWSARTKQGIGNSAVGKALFNKFVDKETKKLINVIMVLVEKDKDKKTAKKIKSDIFRIAVKVIVLHEEKYVSADDFIKLRGNFRRICSATRNGYRTGVIEGDTALRISELIENFALGIKEIISKLVSPATIDRIDSLVNYLGKPDFLVRVSKLKEFDTVAYVLAYYLQET